ncbi:MAG: site-specific integrase [Rhodospirillaceae bacterium]
MVKLNKRIVDAAKPNGTEFFVWDEHLAGFGLRVFASGRKSYLVQYRINGRSRRVTLGKHGVLTPEEARIKARILLGGIADGDDPAEKKLVARNDPTLSEVCDLYLKDGPVMKPDKKQSSWQTDRSNINRHIKPLLGNRKLASLTKADVQRFQADVTLGKSATVQKTGNKRGKAIVRGGPGTAARATTVLCAALSFAVERGLRDTNPGRGVKLNKLQSRSRFLSTAELTALGDVLAEEEQKTEQVWAVAAIRLLTLTGCRKGEILSLKWSYVDLERGMLRLPDSKTGAKVVPVGQPVIDLLSALPRLAGSEYVLPSVTTDGPLVGLQKAWERIRVKAKLSDVRLHDLRHSFASVAVGAGNSLYIVGRILGHKDSRTTEIYAHLADDPVRATANETATHIAGLLGGPAVRAGNENESAVPGIAAE